MYNKIIKNFTTFTKFELLEICFLDKLSLTSDTGVRSPHNPHKLKE